MPHTHWMLAPLLAVIPLQLLAYYIARRARAERRPAAQPGEDGHGRMTAAGDSSAEVGIDLLEIERLERALERRPRLAERLFTDAERAYAAGARGPASTWRRASAPRRRSPRRSGSRPGASATSRCSAATGRRRSGCTARRGAGASARRRGARLADPHPPRRRGGRDHPPVDGVSSTALTSSVSRYSVSSRTFRRRSGTRSSTSGCRPARTWSSPARGTPPPRGRRRR